MPSANLRLNRQPSPQSEGSDWSCTRCELRSSCVASGGRRGPFYGATLVLAAIGFFILPALTALGTAVCCPREPIVQLLGGVGGMAAGMVIAASVARRACNPPSWREDS